MTFINKSVTYSQTIMLRKQLAQVLNKINDCYSSSSKKPFENESYYLIPNNGVKYYLYITNKSDFENGNKDFNLLYFFSKLNTEFCIEIEKHFAEPILLEGFMYNAKNNKKHFLVTDILYKNDSVLEYDYLMRYSLLNKLIKPMNALNDFISVSLHHILHVENEKMVKIMFNNFIYKNQLNSIETVYKYVKENSKYKCLQNQDTQNKLILKTNLPDVYIVKNIDTCKKEGILYIKGIEESKKVANLFKSDTESCSILCKYNNTFYKWEPIID